MKPTCRHKAMDLLARRAHFRRELAHKLRQRGYEEDELDETLDRLEGEGLIDDRRTARDFVEHRLGREPLGRRKLLAELARRGAPEDEAREAVFELTDDDDTELARRAAERHRARSPDGVSEGTLARHLERRGFSRRAIVAVLRDEVPPPDDHESF